MKLRSKKLIILFSIIISSINSNCYKDPKRVSETKEITIDAQSFTAFDWEFYVSYNNLDHLKTETDAIEHYQKIGFFNKLQYCKKFNIVILFHLYDLRQMDEFIDRINKFVRLNDLNNYFLKINIPIDDRLTSFDHKIINKINEIDEDYVFNKINLSTPHHKQLITKKNFRTLYGIFEYLHESIEIDNKNIQIIFSENRGSDIGGFFLLLDQVINQNLTNDFIIKLNTKDDENTRKILTSFLNVKLNKVLRIYQALYSNHLVFDFNNKESLENIDNLYQILSYFNFQQKNFNFCNGGMFVVSNKFTQFFKDYDLIELFNMLHKAEGFQIESNGKIYQAFERFFGYLIDFLNLNTLIVGYHPFNYSYDNTIAINSSISLNYDVNYIKQLIEKNNIKLMAYYFPQFHEVEENNKLWGKGFTEWTLMNRFEGEIKKPHVDVGQYNMLDYTTRKKQGLMAKQFGIDAFCYYHYWFNDKEVMYKGLEKILEDGEPDIPFVFCWANEPWTRNWDGTQKEVLIDQKYGNKAGWKKHFKYLLKFFKHFNYIKEDNCPLFFIYKIEDIVKANALEMLKLWKKMARQEGFDGLKIICILRINTCCTNLEGYVDGFAEHQPTYTSATISTTINEIKVNGKRYKDFQDANEKISNINRLDSTYYRGIFYGFDNSSRRIGLPYTKFARLSYKSFEKLLVDTILRISMSPNIGNNFLMLNSWNEWTEQAMIEPNDIDGYKLLEITKKIFR